MSAFFPCRLLVCLFFFATVSAQDFEMLQYGEGADRYTVFIPAKTPDTCEVVLFLHGNGASNALVYGSWIRHLLEGGRIVVFPKYQNGWLIPVVVKSQGRVEKVLLGSLEHLRTDRKIAVRKVHVIGHSLGGSIGSNIAATVKLPSGLKFSSLALIEPGAWFLKSGRLKNYNALPADLRLMCITGAHDVIAAKRFARFVMDNSPQLPSGNKIHFELTNHYHEKQYITSRHLDPAGPDAAFDTHNRNLIIRLARVVCINNLTDERAFWVPVDRLMTPIIELPACGDLGTWNDGTPIGALRIVQDKQ